MGNIARKAAVGYWLVLGLITFLGLNAAIKIEATGTRLFLVVMVIGAALGAASFVQSVLRDYVRTEKPNGDLTDNWPGWYSQFCEPIVYRRSDRAPYSYATGLTRHKLGHKTSRLVGRFIHRLTTDHNSRTLFNFLLSAVEIGLGEITAVIRH